MKPRRGPQQESAPDTDTSTSTDKGKGSTSTTTDPAAVGNAQDDFFDHLDPRYKVERKLGEEGSVTNSLAMLTAIPEVDLGMECGLILHNAATDNAQCLAPVLAACPLRTSRPSSRRRVRRRSYTSTQPISVLAQAKHSRS